MPPHVRLCRICGYDGVFRTPGKSRQVIEAECDGCGNLTRHRPLCDDWNGSWDLPDDQEASA